MTSKFHIVSHSIQPDAVTQAAHALFGPRFADIIERAKSNLNCATCKCPECEFWHGVAGFANCQCPNCGNVHEGK